MPLIILPSDSQFPADDLFPGDASSLEREDEPGRVAIPVSFASDALVRVVEVGGGTA
jgi:hypothetical protein